MQKDQAITKHTEGFGQTSMERSAELAAIAVAAAAKAEVESRYVMALKKPRNDDDSRVAILKICKNPSFAEKAIYKKPVGGSVIQGPSIRFAEEMLRYWGNVKTIQNTIFEDDNKRVVKVTVIDLESNLSYSREITIDKTVERKDSRGREVLAERTNSYGKRVFIVKATEDELQTKEAALASKVIRNNGLRLIPAHIVDEAMEVAYHTLADKVAKDPDAEKKKLMDAFAGIGIKPSELEKYLKHPLGVITPAELLDLRQVYSALKDGQAVWSDYVQTEQSAIQMPQETQEAEQQTTAPAEAAQPAKRVTKKHVQNVQALAKQAKLTDDDLVVLCMDHGVNGAFENMTLDQYSKICQAILKKVEQVANGSAKS